MLMINGTHTVHVKELSARNANGRSSAASTATPLMLGALYARIEELEERLRKLETVPANGSSKKNAKKRSDTTNGKHDAEVTVALISSVVAMVIDQPHRILSMAPVNGPHSACPWALQGRMHLHASRS